MIITRSPLRISLGGGGTDLPSYYREHTGFVISAAIDKYVYITLHDTFAQEVIVKYSKMEVVPSAEEVKHPIVREALKLVQVGTPHLEITSMADIPGRHGPGIFRQFHHGAAARAAHDEEELHLAAGTGGTGLPYRNATCSGEPIGKQDQYIASFGGITSFQFLPDDTVEVAPLQIPTETLHNLEDNLVLFFTGFTRSASEILKDQDTRSRQGDRR